MKRHISSGTERKERHVRRIAHTALQAYGRGTTVALLDSPTPLEDVVRCVYREETNEMDVIMDCIEILANDRLRQRDTANRRN